MLPIRLINRTFITSKSLSYFHQFIYTTFAINESPIDDIRESLCKSVGTIVIILNIEMSIIKIPAKTNI